MSIEREFFPGFIKTHVLYHASRGEIFGAEMAAELARHGYNISPGTLYPTLHRLERAGYLKGRKAVVNGRARIYYRATPEGLRVLEESRRRLRELVSEVLEEGA